MENLKEKIRLNISEVNKLSSFKEWFSEQKTTDDDVIVINNSFVYREDTKTNKNPKYLAFTSNKTNDMLDLYTYSESRINNDFKIYKREKIKNNLVRLDEIIEKEIRNIGELVFILLGSVNENTTFSKPLLDTIVKTVHYNPTFKSNEIKDESLFINDTSDDEAIWSLISSHLVGGLAEVELTKELKVTIGKILDELEDESYSKLILKKDLKKDSPSILDSMVSILQAELLEYDRSLVEFEESDKKDTQAFNNILRISYNFSTDASTLLKLIINICDLKPIILWGTIYHHCKLSEAFKALPWNRSNSKPSLKNYNNIIGNSRNQAFHKLFPFKNSLSIDLPDNSLKGATLKIFSQYSKKKDNQLSYDDKSMVDVLLDFTRTSDHKIAFSFWEKNRTVMELSIQLIQETNSFLELLYAIKKT
jgi:hypothetical protein